jgi:hypothetical protein
LILLYLSLLVLKKTKNFSEPKQSKDEWIISLGATLPLAATLPLGVTLPQPKFG